jgi:hypothetical protein
MIARDHIRRADFAKQFAAGTSTGVAILNIKLAFHRRTNRLEEPIPKGDLSPFPIIW